MVVRAVLAVCVAFAAADVNAGLISSSAPSFDEQIAQATHVVLGTVDHLVECKVPRWVPVTATRYLKGDGPEMIGVKTLSGPCLISTNTGMRETETVVDSPPGSLPKPGIDVLLLLVRKGTSSGFEPTISGIIRLDGPHRERILVRVESKLNAQAMESN